LVKTSDSSGYFGFFKDGKKHGEGIHLYKNGLVFIGLYDMNTKIDGKVIDPDLKITVYEGEW